MKILELERGEEKRLRLVGLHFHSPNAHRGRNTMMYFPNRLAFSPRMRSKRRRKRLRSKSYFFLLHFDHRMNQVPSYVKQYKRKKNMKNYNSFPSHQLLACSF